MALFGKSGKVDISIYRESVGGITIPAALITGDGVQVTGDEDTVSQETGAGTFIQPLGTYTEPQVEWTLILPDANYLGNIYPDLYTASNDRPTVAGQTVFGSDDCTLREPAKIVVHWTCDPNSDNDWYFPEVLLSHNFTATLGNRDEVLQIPVMGYIQPSEELNGGLVQVGTGSLDAETLFNVSTGEYEPIASS